MAVSDLVGDHCPNCAQRWLHHADYARLETLESLMLHDADLLTVTVWRVLCGYCDETVEVRYAG